MKPSVYPSLRPVDLPSLHDALRLIHPAGIIEKVACHVPPSEAAAQRFQEISHEVPYPTGIKKNIRQDHPARCSNFNC